MTSSEIKALTGQHIMNTYGRFPVAIDHGQGATLYDPEGNPYIDFTSGIGVTDLGYGYQPWLDAITTQAGKLGHVSNLFYTEPPAKLAEALNAEKLILLTDVRGLLRDPHDEDTLIHVLHTYDVPELVAQGIISGGMIPKMQCCVDAIAGGVERVHILDGRIPHSILIELLSDKGIGTMLKRED